MVEGLGGVEEGSTYRAVLRQVTVIRGGRVPLQRIKPNGGGCDSTTRDVHVPYQPDASHAGCSRRTQFRCQEMNPRLSQPGKSRTISINSWPCTEINP